MYKTLLSLSILLLGSYVHAGEAATEPATSPTVPKPLEKPYVQLFTLIGPGKLQDVSDKQIEFIANTYGWINSHGGYWLKPTMPDNWEYPFGPSAGLDDQQRSVAQRLKAINPDMILTNYRNGAYISQNALHEAGEAEKRAPLAIAVYNTSTTLARDLSESDTEVLINPPNFVPKGRPAEYPFMPSTTEEEHSLSKKEYVTWLRLGDEIMRIDKVSATDGKITLTVKRGIWGTQAAAHAATADTVVMAPVYCGSRRPDGNEYYLSGLPGGNSPQPALRYVMNQNKPEFWEMLGDKSKECIDEGYNGPWYDCTVSEWINHSNSYGVRLQAAYDPDLKRDLDHETFREYQQNKIDYMFKRFPQSQFYVNWIFPRCYWDNGTDRKLFSGEEGHHPISGGAIEMYANEGFMDWLPLMKMQIDMRNNNFLHVAWAKKADVGSDHEMPEDYAWFTYGTYLMVHEPGKPMYYGGKWAGDKDPKEFVPPAFVYWDLGKPLESYGDISNALIQGTDHLYGRPFEKGVVAVNPDFEKAQTTRMDQSLYNTRTGAWEQEITVQPRSAVVLLAAD